MAIQSASSSNSEKLTHKTAHVQHFGRNAYADLVASTGARGPYAKSAAQRANILSAARRVFAQLGFSGASMRGIAEEAGITFTGLRRHFATKDELLIAVLEQRDREHADQHAHTRGDELLDSLRSLFDQVLEEPSITEVFTTVSGEAVARDHPAHAFFLERYARVRGMYSEELEQAAGSGDGASLPPHHAAALLVAVMDGLQLQWLLDDSVDAHGAFAAFLGILREDAPGERDGGKDDRARP
ncbi:TetR family transcriptional regulator [Rathayibacter sp. AY2B7]|nr:TetR family transcriptional regulator [Rathayibacter sp. AY2B7]